MPDIKRIGEDSQTEQQQCASEGQAYFEVDVVEDPLEFWIGWKKALLCSEDSGADGEDGDVGADEDEP